MLNPQILIGTDSDLPLAGRLNQYLNSLQDEIDAIELRYQFLKDEILATKRALAGIERSEYKERLSVIPPMAKPKPDYGYSKFAEDIEKAETETELRSENKNKRSYVRVTPEQFRDYFVSKKEFTYEDAAAHFNCNKSTIERRAKEAVESGSLRVKIGRKGKVSWKIFYYVKPSDPGPIHLNPSTKAPEEIAKEIAVRPSGGHQGKRARGGKFTNNKDLREILEICRKQDCRIEKLGNDHIRVTNRRGVSLQMSSTPNHKGTIDAIKRGLRKKLQVNI